jgi:uncharacterized membrane protein YphA (DoxX/SURF4 family)
MPATCYLTISNDPFQNWTCSKNFLTCGKAALILTLNVFRTGGEIMISPVLTRIAIALVWLYQGLWCKLLGQQPHHEAVLTRVPFVNAAHAHAALVAFGCFECILAAWVLWGGHAREAALAQTALLAVMNVGGIWWARDVIPDPVGMLFQNFAFVLLAWVVAGKVRPYVGHN